MFNIMKLFEIEVLINSALNTCAGLINLYLSSPEADKNLTPITRERARESNSFLMFCFFHVILMIQ